MKKTAVLGVDVGTSSIKYSLIGARGQCIKSTSGGYSLDSAVPGQFEIDPEKLWDSVAASIRSLLAETTDACTVDAVCICAMMIMPVFLDAKLQVVRPIIHWQDERLLRESVILKEQGKDRLVAEGSGSLLTGESTLNALSWLRRNEPARFRKISGFIMIKDFIRLRLTDMVCTDFGDASGSLLLDPKTRSWNMTLVRALDIPESILPELRGSDEIAGKVSRGASARTGLPEGVPVVTGTGDGICTILGLGVCEKGEVGITVGSAGVVGVSAGEVPLDSLHRNYIFCHPLPDRWFSVMATAASGDILRWYRSEILGNPRMTYAELDEQARTVEPGSRGVMFLPYILGSRNPYGNPHAFGEFLGLRRQHDQRCMTRAVLEGILLEVLDLYLTEQEVIERRGGTLEGVRVSGGIVQSAFWLQMLADMLGKDLILTGASELGTLGCSILAFTGIRAYPSLQDAIRAMVTKSNVVRFDPWCHEVYQAKYKIFRQIYTAMEPLFPSLGV
ncbi:MAG: FGGY family carbohydrate kinase [Spirochaetia bacterium]